ncbi:hypothetical protein [Arthrobacter sp. zg-Y1110]|uniref:hypothetical protein n=1 Tax=Arthrobacter sp. zg-Y1110 TaxID=2886932 RepID=UPI001D144448|nr:hypothetical protein [Arthrobacter sp. zg-Y1110]MCC3292400.1 hypothetical protein [Arthrobacter sp. zg-Y1110]UWX87164.1 hypothetical protein N2K99_17805 [Arthrobacter sp. zg-Y1110]
MSSDSLANALANGYGREVPLKYREGTRPASLQWFGSDGYCSASVFIGTQLPEDLADDPDRPEVIDAWSRGDKAALAAFRKQADKQRKTHRRELAAKIEAYRAENLQPVVASP